MSSPVATFPPTQSGWPSALLTALLPGKTFSLHGIPRPPLNVTVIHFQLVPPYQANPFVSQTWDFLPFLLVTQDPRYNHGGGALGRVRWVVT